MKSKSSLALTFGLFLTLSLQLSTFAQGTAFTYQGRLTDNVQPANGSYDLRFILYSADAGGSQVGPIVTNPATVLSDGLFAVTLDFGANVFTNADRFLEISVRTNGAASFTPLTPRQQLTATPNALFSGTAATATTALGVAANSVANSGIQDGAITAPKIGSGQVVKSLNSLKDDVNLIAGANVTITPSANNLMLVAGPWSASGSNAFYAGGNVGVGTAAPGEAIHVEGGNILLNSSGEREIRMRRTDLPNAPDFKLGRIVTAGDGSPEFRVLYSDATTPERSVFEFDSKGIVASVKTNVGSHFEGFLAGASEPLFRLNSSPAMQLELGSGGTSLTDVKVRRAGSNTLTFVTGPAGGEIERMRIANNGSVGIGTNNPTAKLEVAGTVKATAFQGDGSALATLNGANISSGTISETRIDGAIARDSEIVPTVLANDGAGSGLDADRLDGFDSAAFSLATHNHDSAYWKLGGNGGTTAGTHFLGTTDNRPLELKVNGVRALRLEPGLVIGIPNVLGGSANNSVASGVDGATISGGRLNIANGDFSTVSGGQQNIAGDDGATVGGGYGNVAGGFDATVPGGSGNSAAGNFSFAAGSSAKADHIGAFVWNDGAAGDFSSTVANQFSVHAIGGARFVTEGAGMTLDGQLSATGLSTSGSIFTKGVLIGSASSDYRQLQIGGGNTWGFLYGAFPRWGDGIHLGYNYYWSPTGGDVIPAIDGPTSRLSVGYGTIVLAVGGIGAAPTAERLVVSTASVTVNGTFNNNSDRNAKRDFAPVNPSHVLAKVTQLPISEWSYHTEAATRHIGPMAQDFHSAFHVGTDDKHIAPIDEGGVALAAIQGLNQKLEERTKFLEGELKRRDTENVELIQRLNTLEKIILRQKTN